MCGSGWANYWGGRASLGRVFEMSNEMAETKACGRQEDARSQRAEAQLNCISGGPQSKRRRRPHRETIGEEICHESICAI